MERPRHDTLTKPHAVARDLAQTACETGAVREQLGKRAKETVKLRQQRTTLKTVTLCHPGDHTLTLPYWTPPSALGSTV